MREPTASPPQGYQNAFIRPDANGKVGIFDTTGNEFLYFWRAIDGATIPTTTVPSWRNDLSNNIALNATGDIRLRWDYGANVRLGAVISEYSNGGNTQITAGQGMIPILGLDNRSGLTAVDGSPITLYTLPTGTGKLYRVTADIFATAFTSGTATYTITWTENAVTRTLVVTATALNVLGTGTDLINPDASTAITAQLTGTFTATVKVASVVERIA